MRTSGPGRKTKMPTPTIGDRGYFLEGGPLVSFVAAVDCALCSREPREGTLYILPRLKAGNDGHLHE